MNWSASDKQIEKLRKSISAEFQNFSNSLKIDELNVTTLRKSVSAMYKRMDKRNRKAFCIICKQSWTQVCRDEHLTELDDEMDFMDLVEDIVSAYNSTTQFRYDTEMERKVSRCVEAILSCTNKRSAKDALDRACRAWFNQTRQYCDESVRAARRKAFESAGIDYVIWHTQKDGKVCQECHDRDCQTFRLSNLPDRHWHCRCWYTPKV